MVQENILPIETILHIFFHKTNNLRSFKWSKICHNAVFSISS